MRVGAPEAPAGVVVPAGQVQGGTAVPEGAVVAVSSGSRVATVTGVGRGFMTGGADCGEAQADMVRIISSKMVVILIQYSLVESLS
jgi:hypothetical protein